MPDYIPEKEISDPIAWASSFIKKPGSEYVFRLEHSIQHAGQDSNYVFLKYSIYLNGSLVGRARRFYGMWEDADKTNPEELASLHEKKEQDKKSLEKILSR